MITLLMNKDHVKRFNKCIPMLDTLLTKTADGMIKTTVYRKKDSISQFHENTFNQCLKTMVTLFGQ